MMTATCTDNASPHPTSSDVLDALPSTPLPSLSEGGIMMSGGGGVVSGGGGGGGGDGDGKSLG